MHKRSNYSFSADIIRALAIVLVVLIHVFSEFLNYPKVIGSVDWWIADVINAASRIAVPLFIMLSGMLILHTEKSYTIKEFLKKRVSKIGVPLIAWPIIYFVWNTWLHQTHFTLLSVITDFINLNIYYHLYYIYIIAGLYLITPLLKIIINNATHELKTYFFVLTLLFTLLLTASIYFFRIDINLSTIYTVFIPYLSYYLAGDYFRNKKLTKKQMYLGVILFIGLTLVTAFGTYWHMLFVTNSQGANAIDYGKYFYDYTGLTVVMMSIIAFVLLHNVTAKLPSLQSSRFATIIVSLAGASFGIYLIHPLFLEFSNKILGIPFEALPIPLSIFIFIKLFALLFASYIFVLVIKRIPLLKALV